MQEHTLLHLGSTDDEALIRQSLEGCTDCFAVLFHRYCKLVFAIAWKVLRQQSEAEDIVQEVFLTIFQQQNPYDPCRGSVRTWIANFAQYKALVRRRYLNSRSLSTIEDLAAFERGSNLNPHQSMLEKATFVDQSLSRLNPRQKRTIELIHFDGYTLAETAVFLNESLANTRNHYYRGMKSLREQTHAGKAADELFRATPAAHLASQDDTTIVMNGKTQLTTPGV